MISPSNIVPFIELSSLGILGLSFLFLVKWVMNSMGQAIWALTLTILDMHKTLIRHDAQIRGVNPTTRDNDTDAHLKASQEYLAILETITDTTALLKERIRAPKARFSIFG